MNIDDNKLENKIRKIVQEELVIYQNLPNIYLGNGNYCAGVYRPNTNNCDHSQDYCDKYKGTPYCNYSNEREDDPRFAPCIICNKKHEIESTDYNYWRKLFKIEIYNDKPEYICGKCLSSKVRIIRNFGDKIIILVTDEEKSEKLINLGIKDEIKVNGKNIEHLGLAEEK